MKKQYRQDIVVTSSNNGNSGVFIPSLLSGTVDGTAINIGIDATTGEIVKAPADGGSAEVGPTAPTSPSTGDLWYNTTDNNFYVWDGDSWEIVGGGNTQVNSDWNATSGVAKILNKPTLGTAASADISDFATSVQGTLADTALQPGDNISELTNDAGYITSDSLPTVNDATLTIQKEGVAVNTFTANSATNKTVNIVETDPVFSASPAAGITAGDITNWNNDINTNIYTDDGTISDAQRFVTLGTVGDGEALIFQQATTTDNAFTIASQSVDADTEIGIDSSISVRGTSGKIVIGYKEPVGGPGDVPKAIIDAVSSDLHIGTYSKINISSVQTNVISNGGIDLNAAEDIYMTSGIGLSSAGIIKRESNGRLTIATGVSASRYVETITPVANIQQTITHNKGTEDVIVQVYDATTKELVYVEVQILTTNTVGITSTTTNDLRVVVL